MDNLSLFVTPFEPFFYPQIAEIHCLACSVTRLTRWKSSTPANSATRVEQIPPPMLKKTLRDYLHQALDPRIILVAAVAAGQVVGIAKWSVPACLSRSETIFESTYRKAVEFKDYFEDWVSPPRWMSGNCVKQYSKAQKACAESFLGSGKLDKVWYLKSLAVHPSFQRKGIGSALMDWGLRKAGSRGEMVYLEASDKGKELYLRNGFVSLGELVVGSEAFAVETCMSWTP